MKKGFFINSQEWNHFQFDWPKKRAQLLCGRVGSNNVFCFSRHLESD